MDKIAAWERTQLGMASSHFQASDVQGSARALAAVFVGAARREVHPPVTAVVGALAVLSADLDTHPDAPEGAGESFSPLNIHLPGVSGALSFFVIARGRGLFQSDCNRTLAKATAREAIARASVSLGEYFAPKRVPADLECPEQIVYGAAVELHSGAEAPTVAQLSEVVKASALTWTQDHGEPTDAAGEGVESPERQDRASKVPDSARPGQAPTSTR